MFRLALIKFPEKYPIGSNGKVLPDYEQWASLEKYEIPVEFLEGYQKGGVPLKFIDLSDDHLGIDVQFTALADISIGFSVIHLDGDILWINRIGKALPRCSQTQING